MRGTKEDVILVPQAAREPGAFGRIQRDLPERLLDVDDHGLDVGRLGKPCKSSASKATSTQRGKKTRCDFLLAPLTPLALQSRMILYLVDPSTQTLSRQHTLESTGSRPRYSRTCLCEVKVRT